MRRRNNQFCYDLEVSIPFNMDNDFYTDINNLEDIACIINREYFSGLTVISRAMINNWIYYPHRNRKNYANCFRIIKREVEGVI